MKLQADNRVGAEEEVQGPCAGGDHFTPRPLQVVPPPYISVLIIPGSGGGTGEAPRASSSLLSQKNH